MPEARSRKQKTSADYSFRREPGYDPKLGSEDSEKEPDLSKWLSSNRDEGISQQEDLVAPVVGYRGRKRTNKFPA